MAKLFKPFPVPSLRIDDSLGVSHELDPRSQLARRPMLFGRKKPERLGEFIAALYDARIKFVPDNSSKRWRLKFERDATGRIKRGADGLPVAVREFGMWQDSGLDPDSPTQDEIAAIGEGDENDWFRIPFGSQQGGYRDLNAQFSQMNQKTQTVPIKKPATLITDATNSLGTIQLSTIQNKVESPKADGFLVTAPQSHYMDSRFDSGTFGKFIEPENASILDRIAQPFYWNASSTLRVRLKHGVSHLHLWCPSGEYRELDTFDKTNFKITRHPFFEAEEASLVIKTAWDHGTQWRVYLMPQRVQMVSHWIDYYDSFTFFTHFVHGFHNIRNTLTRLPVWPVPYGMIGSDLTDIFGIDEWIYYQAQWHGPFNPGPVNLRSKPAGWVDGQSPGNLTGGTWEGPPAHGGDYSLEYEIGHRTLLSHNVFALEVISVFFLFLYNSSSPVGYYARLALQQPGDLAAVVKPCGTHWRDPKDTFYIWHRTVKGEQPRTLNWGTFLWDFGVRGGGIPFDSQYSLSAAMQLGGWR